MPLSPLDDRYENETAPLCGYFSEFAYIKYRVLVEIQFLIHLKKLSKKYISIVQAFSIGDARRVKELEETTKHDAKAIEYFLKEKIKSPEVLPYVHFGLTSEDINNLAYGCMLTDSLRTVLLPEIKQLLVLIHDMVKKYAASVMVARTHGQPAVPTTFGKELAVFYVRLKKLEKRLRAFRFEGKMNGAVGNYNALAFAYPKTDWIRFSRGFISSFDLVPNLVTTQILPADSYVEYFLLLFQINTVLLGLSQDMWSYISRGLVRQKRVEGQVGSSTMPQKINPIDFENAEGNIQIANSYFELFARKLSVSRMQRDLSDSTVKRTIGTALGHTLLAWKSMEKGLGKISFDEQSAEKELDDHWEILAEAMQIYFKLYGDEKGYEKVKKMMMGKTIDKKTYQKIVKEYPPLARLTPRAYIGLAEKIVKKFV